MKVTITGEYWNWKHEYEGQMYGRGHDYHGQSQEQIENTAQREWDHDLVLLIKAKKL